MPQTKPSQALVKTEPKDLTRSARSFLAAAKSPNTIRAYQADWRHFEGWASDHDRDALAATPATVVAYLTDLSDVAKVSTLERRMAAISQAHQIAGSESPPLSAKSCPFIFN